MMCRFCFLTLTRYRERAIGNYPNTFLWRHPTHADARQCLQIVLEKKSLDTSPATPAESA